MLKKLEKVGSKSTKEQNGNFDEGLSIRNAHRIKEKRLGYSDGSTSPRTEEERR